MPFEWISVKERLPEDFQDVYIKTDCEDCPILKAMYCDKFILLVLIQCERHLEPDERDFKLIKRISQQEVDLYANRITHWMPAPHP